MSAQETIAVLGAGGTMGQGMARNLLRAGFGVHAWNRSRNKVEPLAEDGAWVFDSAAEAVAGAGVVLTMLTDADAVIEAMADVHRGPGADPLVWIQMSTIGEAGTERCMALAREREMAFVDAPVSGTKQPAEEGKLIILASGPEGLRERMDPIFAAVGRKTVWAGEAGAGSRLKVAVNAWLLTVVEGVAETLALTEGLGLDPELFLEAVSGGPLDAPFVQLKARAMLDRAFAPQFTLALATKDAGLAVDSAAQRGLDLPLLGVIHARMASAVPEHGGEDLSVTYLSSTPSPASA